MNEQNPEAAPMEPTLPPVPYKDRSVGLIIFGILTILLGCLSGLLVPLMLFAQMASAKTTGAPPPFSVILPGILLYGFLAVALVWLGIGSIMARRWARALLLIFSWSWLIMGVFVLYGIVHTENAGELNPRRNARPSGDACGSNGHGDGLHVPDIRRPVRHFAGGLDVFL
jgi:hypothetical protein